jgi:hypothetical protein
MEISKTKRCKSGWFTYILTLKKEFELINMICDTNINELLSEVKHLNTIFGQKWKETVHGTFMSNNIHKHV